jgi:MtN3 and saliva related transmembrane protein
MFLHDWIGLLAGTLTTVAFIPQVIKIWRTKKADDISISMFLIFTVGVGLWMIYGIQIASAGHACQHSHHDIGAYHPDIEI